MEQQILTIWDLVLTPIYLVVLILIARRNQDKRYPLKHPLRKYYLPGLYAKFGGALFIGLLYAFYYKGGDTLNYFSQAKILNTAFNDSFDTWLKLVLHTSPENAPEIYTYTSQIYWYNSPSEYIVVVITAVLGVFNFTSYMPIALLFAFFAYSGIWAMYKTFVQLYPNQYKPLAIAFLFIPSTVVWGSGIFKDTICMFGLGWMTYCTFRIFINKDLSPKNLILLFLSLFLVAQTKLYILLAFLPALSLWLLLTYSYRIKTAFLRFIVNIAFIGASLGMFLFFSNRFANELNKYSLERIAQTAATTSQWITYVSDVQEGSAYDLGKFEPTLTSMLSKFPQSVVVTFFRPFPWEVKKAIVALSMLEALALIYLTLQMFFNRKSKPIRSLVKDPNLLFCLIFALIFAFAVGISSGNFGALSRYKIPCLPFYGAILAIMLNNQTKTVRRTTASTTIYKRAQLKM